MENQRVHDTKKNLELMERWPTMLKTRQNIAEIFWMLRMMATMP